jgi:DNA-directed RNA polymerase specialized sigma24 family protein
VQAVTEEAPKLDELASRRARRLDADAFVELVGRNDLSHRRLAFRLLGDRDRMDDVLQNAYVRAFRGLRSFRGDASLETWLYRIVYNACIDDLAVGATRSRSSNGTPVASIPRLKTGWTSPPRCAHCPPSCGPSCC